MPPPSGWATALNTSWCDPRRWQRNIRGAGSVDVGDAPDLVDAILDSRRDGGHRMSTVALHHRVRWARRCARSSSSIHAIGTSIEMWAPQVPALSRDFRVLSIDLRGHGRSPVPSGPYAMGELADDVIACSTSEGIERASVCGLSLGGMVALTIAASASRSRRPAHRRLRCRGTASARGMARPSASGAGGWFDGRVRSGRRAVGIPRSGTGDRAARQADARSHPGSRLRRLLRGDRRHGPASDPSDRGGTDTAPCWAVTIPRPRRQSPPRWPYRCLTRMSL